MSNEVLIVVRSKSDVKQGFDSAERDLGTFADRSGDTYNQRFSRKMDQLGTVLQQPLQRAGRKIGDDLGEKAGDEFGKVLAVNIGKGGAQITYASEKAGTDIGDTMGDKAGEKVSDKITEKVRTSGGRAKPSATQAGDEIGQSMGERTGEKLTERIREDVGRSGSRVSGESRRSGDRIGEDMGQSLFTRLTSRIREAVTRKVRVHTDTDVNASMGGRAEEAGKEIGDKINAGVGGSMSTFFSGDFITLILKSLSVAALAAALAPVLGAAVITAFGLAIGGGVLAAGIVSAFRDPRIKGAAKDLKKDVDHLFEAFGRPFRAPIADFLEKFDRFLNSSQVKNAAKTLGDIFAPIAGQLGTGFIGMLQNMLPGLTDLAKAAAPLFETLAKHLPQIGDALSKMFDSFAEQGDDANVFFDDLLTFIEKTLVFLGKLIAKLASAYSALHNLVVNGVQLFRDLGSAVAGFARGAERRFLQFVLFCLDQLGRLLAGAGEALGWIPGIGDKLRGAQNRFTDFRKRVNAELARIHDKEVTIKIRQVFTTVGNIVGRIAGLIGKASGGIVGAVGHAAEGGIRNGLTLVGENGPELADLAPGTRVHSNGDSRRMLAGGGGVTKVLLSIDPNAPRGFMRELLRALRAEIRAEAGSGPNSVQLALGGSVSG